VGRYYRINQYIQADEVRVVGEDGRQVGVMPVFNAIQEARKLGVDLVEVAPSAKPPVCKLIDFKKFKYQEAKKEREAKKGQKGGGLKEVRLTPFIASNDLSFRLKRAKEFLEEGDKVRLSVRFTGRQLTHKEFGDLVLSKALANLEGIAKKEAEPKWLGKDFFIILAPNKGKAGKKNGPKNEN
jgi:translation initiation factor IF-3